MMDAADFGITFAGQEQATSVPAVWQKVHPRVSVARKGRKNITLLEGAPVAHPTCGCIHIPQQQSADGIFYYVANALRHFMMMDGYLDGFTPPRLADNPFPVVLAINF